MFEVSISQSIYTCLIDLSSSAKPPSLAKTSSCNSQPRLLSYFHPLPKRGTVLRQLTKNQRLVLISFLKQKWLRRSTLLVIQRNTKKTWTLLLSQATLMLLHLHQALRPNLLLPSSPGSLFFQDWARVETTIRVSRAMAPTKYVETRSSLIQPRRREYPAEIRSRVSSSEHPGNPFPLLCPHWHVSSLNLTGQSKENLQFHL